MQKIIFRASFFSSFPKRINKQILKKETQTFPGWFFPHQFFFWWFLLINTYNETYSKKVLCVKWESKQIILFLISFDGFFLACQYEYIAVFILQPVSFPLMWFADKKGRINISAFPYFNEISTFNFAWKINEMSRNSSWCNKNKLSASQQNNNEKNANKEMIIKRRNYFHIRKTVTISNKQSV